MQVVAEVEPERPPAAAAAVPHGIHEQKSVVQDKLAVDEVQLVTPPKRKGPVSNSSPLPHEKRLRAKTSVTPFFSEPVKAQIREALDQYGLAGQGNPEKRLFSKEPVPVCQLCGAERHQVKWQVRLTGKGLVKTSGSQCYSCVRATMNLQCTRSETILKSIPSALHVVRVHSGAVRNELRSRHRDFCDCHVCLGNECEEQA